MKKLLKSFFAIAVILIAFSSCKHDPLVVACNTSSYTYGKDVKPIMDAYCTGCHKENSTEENGGIYLNDWASLSAYVTDFPGDFKGAIDHAEGYSPMPDEAPKMPDCEITKLKNWIDAGAPNN